MANVARHAIQDWVRSWAVRSGNVEYWGWAESQGRSVCRSTVGIRRCLAQSAVANVDGVLWCARLLTLGRPVRNQEGIIACVGGEVILHAIAHVFSFRLPDLEVAVRETGRVAAVAVIARGVDGRVVVINLAGHGWLGLVASMRVARQLEIVSEVVTVVSLT